MHEERVVEVGRGAEGKPVAVLGGLAFEHLADPRQPLGVDVVQFDEPAFNVYMDEVSDWGIKALERAAEGLTCATAVHICYGYGIKANTDWKQTLGAEWRQYEDIFPAIAASPTADATNTIGSRALTS